jgi:hypothetical protein
MNEQMRAGVQTKSLRRFFNVTLSAPDAQMSKDAIEIPVRRRNRTTVAKTHEAAAFH